MSNTRLPSTCEHVHADAAARRRRLLRLLGVQIQAISPTSIPSAARRTLRHASFSHSTLLNIQRTRRYRRPPSGTTARRCIRSGALEPVAVAGQRLHGQRLLAPREAGEARGDFCGISRFREYRISGARGGQGRTRHKQCAESRRTSRPNLASFSRVSTRRETGRKGIWGEKSLVHLSHLVRSGQTRMSSVGPLQTGHVEKLRKTCQKERSFIWRGRSSCLYGTSSMLQKKGGVGVLMCVSGDALLGGAALGEHFFGVFRGH